MLFSPVDNKKRPPFFSDNRTWSLDQFLFAIQEFEPCNFLRWLGSNKQQRRRVNRCVASFLCDDTLTTKEKCADTPARDYNNSLVESEFNILKSVLFSLEIKLPTNEQKTCHHLKEGFICWKWGGGCFSFDYFMCVCVSNIWRQHLNEQLLPTTVTNLHDKSFQRPWFMFSLS